MSWANGDTSRFAPASIYSGRSQGGKSPLSVCPADHCSLPAQAIAPVISSFPSAFIPGRAVRTVIIGATLCFLRMLSGSHRSGFTAANIGRRACPLRFEVHFLQILPSTKSNWQEKPSYEAVPAAGYRIYKIPERFRQRKEPKRGKK